MARIRDATSVNVEVGGGNEHAAGDEVFARVCCFLCYNDVRKIASQKGR